MTAGAGRHKIDSPSSREIKKPMLGIHRHCSRAMPRTAVIRVSIRVIAATRDAWQGGASGLSAGAGNAKAGKIA